MATRHSNGNSIYFAWRRTNKKKSKKKKNGAIKTNLYLAVGHFWLAGLAGTVLAWPENRKPTSPSPHTINHYRRLISLSAASEIKNSNRFMRATAGSPSKANAIVQSCLVFFLWQPPLLVFIIPAFFVLSLSNGILVWDEWVV